MIILWVNSKKVSIYPSFSDLLITRANGSILVLRAAIIWNPQWSEYLHAFGVGIPHECMEYHIAQGLAYLRKIFEDPRVLVRSQESERLLYVTQNFTLECTIKTVSEAQFYDAQWYEIEEIMEQFPQSSDPDSGPVDAWEWARNTPGYDLLIGLDYPIHFRTWGYVMWDRARLDEWGVLETTYEKHDASAVMEKAELRVSMDKELIDLVLERLREAEARIDRGKERELKWP